MTTATLTLSHPEALIYTMVLASAVDSAVKDEELRTMGDVVRTLPVFATFDPENLPRAVESCMQLISSGEHGVEEAIAVIRDSLPPYLRETAYALALDVVAADGQALQEELRLLEMMRHRFDIDRLVAAGIERGARARWAHP
ncbi:tellurite resistance TerB family protein [Roseospira marina]|uniref:Tellurite resistance TerB family protein n=1 Tax=Roseospira marina TaxID=140057 RepID=A0A5M6IAE2_9PROT|nr:tellurite resistance TerB family protein [Roseospira marina]KAA5605234.1 tellurite resistance TerB family protein [Roseospira marina]MBB4314690.1 tellurite resistance protein [Roseospira marina]MBB5087679.1 tellurite resistance protein [Roseospira marina]